MRTLLYSPRASPMLSREPVFVFEFDRAAPLRAVNQAARQLLVDEAAADATRPLGPEALRALREAASKSEQQGSSVVDVTLNTESRRLRLCVHVTASTRPGRFCLVATQKRALEREGLAPEGAARLAHHIRNPMAGIRGAVEVIGSQLPPELGLACVVRQIVERIDQLDRSLDSMLSYLCPETPRLEHVHLKGFVQHLLQEGLDPAGLAAGVQLSCKPEAEDTVLVADPHQLRQVLRDLIANAAEALPAGSGSVEVTLDQEPLFAEICVVDTGEGIPSAVLPRVCEPFFTTKPRALGLGLARARKVAHAHGGDLVVTSCEGHTQVRLRLPLVHE